MVYLLGATTQEKEKEDGSKGRLKTNTGGGGEREKIGSYDESKMGSRVCHKASSIKKGGGQGGCAIDEAFLGKKASKPGKDNTPQTRTTGATTIKGGGKNSAYALEENAT